MNESESTMLVTGGNSGLGFECARILATRNKKAHLILACRDMKKAEAAADRMRGKSGNPNIGAMELDVSSLGSVRSFAARFDEQRRGPLSGILCNAGVNGLNAGITPDGFDVVFETNHLGHFLLTAVLLPRMEADGRIVVVSSDMHNPPGENLTWPGADALAHPTAEFGGAFIRYSLSKLCNLYFAYELAGRLERLGSGISVNAFNPGLMTDTNFAPDKSRFTEAFLERVADRIGCLEDSAEALADMMTDARFAGMSGKYNDRGTVRPSSPLSYDAAKAAELWSESVGYARLSPEETWAGLLGKA